MSHQKQLENREASAAIIVIGDEILKGQIQDANTIFLTKELKSCGVVVKRVLILPDDLIEISTEIKNLCQSNFTYIFTCGGVGPTHDDITFEAVAKAFDEELVLSPEIKRVLEQHFTEDLLKTALKMAMVPKSAMVDYSRIGKGFPEIKMKNLFILPGVPKLLQQTFSPIREDLFKAHAKLKTEVLQCFIKSNEFAITDQLNLLVKKYEESVTFGSYPSWDHNYYETKLTIEATNDKIAQEVLKEVKETMDVIDYDEFPLIETAMKIESLLSKSESQTFMEQVKKSQKVIQNCFNEYDLDQVAIAFNGGKDSMVLLHLIHIFLQENKSKRGQNKLQALYIRDADPFPQVEEFIDSCKDNYSLDLITIEGSMKEALTEMLQKRPKIKANLMGTRKSDPCGKNLSYFSPTDGNWPEIMRINPLLDWDYSHIWQFLRGLHLPYPLLYDQGYTSLGGRSNTSPNPNLIQLDKNGVQKFKPAYCLEDGSQERAGRGK